MKLSRLLPLAVALFVAIALIPRSSTGYSTIGGSLSAAQRDFRIFNNFGDSSANDNTSTTSQFPGYTGAPLAIWKACVEWGSEPHGNGGGDPHQGTLGSGGANFDASFQGLATEVGGQNQNTHSAISGSDGSTLAFMESGGFNGIANGWRIRYFEGWNWDDGPSTNINGHDLQGVATHEYGHALGLGHTSVSNATMRGSIIQDGVPDRSIQSDDIDGVRAVYGDMASDKPRITDVIITGTFVQITGENFSDEDNEVWFTQAGVGGTGNPVKALGIDSQNGGTFLVAPVPAEAGSGDVLVRKTGTGPSVVSNAYPFDGSLLSCTGGVNYCGSTPNSSFASGALMSVSGSTSVNANNFTVEVSNAKTSSFGIFFYGPVQVSVPTADGVRCIGGRALGLVRLGAQATSAAGTASRTLDLTNPITPQAQIFEGAIRNFQFFYRDVQGGPFGFNFSDAISVHFCP